MSPRRKYVPLLKIASGGTAAVWVGAAEGAHGFRQLVAIKRPHAHLADDKAFRAALVEEAKIAARLRHANAVDVRDVEEDENGIQLVMDWIEGGSLSDLIRAWSNDTPRRVAAVAIRIVLDACQGLDALHELTGDEGQALGCVHRDVSPANVLVGLDGASRITDFGLAKPLYAVERTTSEGALRGKLGYMAPEYIRGKSFDRRVDVFAMAIVLWEALARKRLFRGENDADTLDRVQRQNAPSLAFSAPWLGEASAPLDALLERALAKDPDARIASIAAFSDELEAIARQHDLFASHAEVRDAFPPALRAELDDRRRRVNAALHNPPEQTPASATGESLPAHIVPNVGAQKRARALVLLPLGIGAAVALGLAFTLVDGGGARPAIASANVVASDRQARAEDVRGRATATTQPPAPIVTHVAGKVGPTPASAAPPSGPAGFAPRPNPYDKH